MAAFKFKGQLQWFNMHLYSNAYTAETNSNFSFFFSSLVL